MKKSRHTKEGYYDWNYIDSYLNDYNLIMVIGARGCGKTYGLRKAAVNDYIQRGERFVEIVRYKTELKDFSNGYFDKMQENDEFPNYQFQVKGAYAYIAPAEQEKPKWELCGYFVALSDFQRKKKITFAKVRRIIFDECVIDKRDRYHRYLVNEFGVLMEMLNTILREKIDEPTRGRVFLLGNACDLTCPYFEELGVNQLDEYGLHFERDTKVLIDYVEPWDMEERKTRTLVGLLSSKNENAAMFQNKFSIVDSGLIGTKTSNARFHYALILRGAAFGVWFDSHECLFFISAKIPKNQEQRTYALTAADGTFNYRIIRRADELIKPLVAALYYNCVRYESEVLRENFRKVLAFLGVKDK